MKISLSLVGVSALMSLALVGPMRVSAAESKFGFIDMQRAIQSVEPGKKAKKELEGEFASKKKKLEQKEKDVKEMYEDLEKKAMVMSEEVRNKKRAELQEEQMKLQKLMAQSQMELQQRERELTTPILEKLHRAIDHVADKDGYTMIFEKNEQSVLWAKKEADLTERVVAEFSKMPDDAKKKDKK